MLVWPCCKQQFFATNQRTQTPQARSENRPDRSSLRATLLLLHKGLGLVRVRLCFGVVQPHNSFCFSVTQSGHTAYYAATAATPLNTKGMKNNTPFRVITVPSSIIPSHSDIFKPNTDALLSAILQLQDSDG